jgi:hypothetical protein
MPARPALARRSARGELLAQLTGRLPRDYHRGAPRCCGCVSESSFPSASESTRARTRTAGSPRGPSP